MESAQYYKNKLKSLRKAVTSFALLMEIDLSSREPFERDVYKNGAVQKFEYSIELFWKVAKLYLFLYKGIDESSPKGVLKAFYQESNMTLETYEVFMTMILHRNLLSHVYDSEQFENIYKYLKCHSKVLLAGLELFPEE